MLSADNSFANRLDPDQARQNVGPDLDSNCLTCMMLFLKDFFKKVDHEENSEKQSRVKHYNTGLRTRLVIRLGSDQPTQLQRQSRNTEICFVARRVILLNGKPKNRL